MLHNPDLVLNKIIRKKDTDIILYEC